MTLNEKIIADMTAAMRQKTTAFGKAAAGESNLMNSKIEKAHLTDEEGRSPANARPAAARFMRIRKATAMISPQKKQ